MIPALLLGSGMLLVSLLAYGVATALLVQAIVRLRRNLVGSTTSIFHGQEEFQRWATLGNQKVGCLLRRTVTPMTVAHNLVYGVDLRSVGNIPRTGPSPGRN